jgi:hypothetical protein
LVWFVQGVDVRRVCVFGGMCDMFLYVRDALSACILSYYGDTPIEGGGRVEGEGVGTSGVPEPHSAFDSGL